MSSRHRTHLNSTVVTTEVLSALAKFFSNLYLNSTVVTTEENVNAALAVGLEIFKFYCSNN